MGDGGRPVGRGASHPSTSRLELLVNVAAGVGWLIVTADLFGVVDLADEWDGLPVGVAAVATIVGIVLSVRRHTGGSRPRSLPARFVMWLIVTAAIVWVSVMVFVFWTMRDFRF